MKYTSKNIIISFSIFLFIVVSVFFVFGTGSFGMRASGSEYDFASTTLGSGTDEDWAHHAYTTGFPENATQKTIDLTSADANRVAGFLARFASLVNNGNLDTNNVSYAKYKVKLPASIDLSEYLWIPIGTEEHPFEGEIICENNSASAVISGMRIYTWLPCYSGIKYFGLVGYATAKDGTKESSSTLYNISLNNFEIVVSKPSTDIEYYVGALAGYADKNIKRVNATGVINLDYTKTYTENKNIGGLVGWLGSNGKITWDKAGTSSIAIKAEMNSLATGVVTSNGNAGLIAGINQGSIDASSFTLNNSSAYITLKIPTSNFGGAVYQNNGTVSNYTNYTNLQVGSAIYKVGGVAAINNKDITDCSNTADIVATENNTQEANNTDNCIGGIAGITTKNSTIKKCTNTGTIGANLLGVNSVGGIAGINQQGTIGSSETELYTSFVGNSGFVYGRYAGGIVGQTNKGDTTAVIPYIYQCYNGAKSSINICGNDKDKSYVGGIVGYNTAPIVIKNCANNTTIGDNNTNLGDSLYSGGIIGRCIAVSKDGSEAAVKIENCANYGDIYATSKSSGIIGFVDTSSGDNEIGLTKVMSLGAVKTSVGGMACGLCASSIDHFVVNVAYYDITKGCYGEDASGIYVKQAVYSFANNGHGTKTESTRKQQLTAYELMTVSSWKAPDYYNCTGANSDTYSFRSASSDTNGTIYYYPVLQALKNLYGPSSERPMNYPDVRLCNARFINQDGSNDGAGSPISAYSATDIEYESQNSYPVQYVIRSQKYKEPNTTSYTPKENYSGHWKNGSNDYSFDSAAVNGDLLTVYLVWEPDVYEISYYLKVNDTDGYVVLNEAEYNLQSSTSYSETAATLVIDSAESIERLTRTGYNFDGWYLFDALQDPTDVNLSDGTKVSEINRNASYANGIFLYAHYNPITITITYSAGISPTGLGVLFSDSTTSKSKEVTYNEPFVLSTDFEEQNGIYFNGYFTEERGGEQITDTDGSSLNVSNFTTNIQLYARWDSQVFQLHLTIKQYGISSTLPANQVILADYDVRRGENASNIRLSCISTSENYILDNNIEGYELASEGAGRFYSDTAYTTPFDFYAELYHEEYIYIKYVPKKYNVTFSANGGYFGTQSNLQPTRSVALDYGTDVIAYAKSHGFVRNGSNEPKRSGCKIILDSADNSTILFTGRQIDINDDWSASDILHEYRVPSSDITVYVLWEKGVFSLSLDAGDSAGFRRNNSGALEQMISQEVNFGASVLTAIENMLRGVSISAPMGQGLKGWLYNYDEVTSSLSMPSKDIVVMAEWADVVTVTFYVADLSDDSRQIKVFKGAKFSTADISKVYEIQDSINIVGFVFDHWSRIISRDENRNISSQPNAFDFYGEVINSDMEMVAVFDADPSYKPPVFNTKNYIVITVIVGSIIIVILFLLIWTRSNKKKRVILTPETIKGSELQEQLRQIKEMERRRKDIDQPFD